MTMRNRMDYTQTIIQLKPDSAIVYSRLADAYCRTVDCLTMIKGDYDRAIAWITPKRLIQLNPR